MKKIHFAFLIVFIGFLACGSEPVDLGKLKVTDTDYFDTLQNWMTGSFSSAVQAENDSDYYDICLEMHSVWKDSDSIFYLYVEQSLASMTDKPYRQRVYKVQRLEDGFISDVYELPNPSLFTGQWRNSELWSMYTPDSIVLKSGCGVELTWTGSYFEGGTDSATCLSTLRGAAYAMSQVDVMQDRIVSWDQGYDSLGTQVWGAEKGGYIFLRNQ